MWGVRGRALSYPRTLVRSGVRPGPTTHWLWVRGVQAWGPVTNPTACALARCGGGMRVPGGGVSCLGVGRLGSGALPPPTTRAFGRAAGARFALAVAAVCGRGGPAVLGTVHQTANQAFPFYVKLDSGKVTSWAFDTMLQKMNASSAYLVYEYDVSREPQYRCQEGGTLMEL